MSLSNLFRVNFPYGIRVNTENNSVAFFNREYGQLGTNDAMNCDLRDTEKIETKYKSLTLDKIIDIVEKNLGKTVSTSKQGNHVCIFFYDDLTNPSNKGNGKYYAKYFKILEDLSKYLVA